MGDPRFRPGDSSVIPAWCSATTNNAYTDVDPSLYGDLQRLRADVCCEAVAVGRIRVRLDFAEHRRPNQTTNPQAEVLYPVQARRSITSVRITRGRRGNLRGASWPFKG